LRAGINVIATLNVQHLESVYEMVEQATGVRVKERLPDYVLGMADQLVNVDVSAEDLRERLSAGKIYPKERIEAALTNFFTPPNLSRLRELTLSEIAHQLDKRRRAQGGEFVQGGSERVMVCLSSRSPNTATLLRKGSRLADRMGVPWYAVYIRTPSEQIERIDAMTQRQIANNLALAQQLGAVTMQWEYGKSFVEGVAKFVEEYSITHILMGRSQRPWYRRWFGMSVIDQLLQAVPYVDVLVVGNTRPSLRAVLDE
jgi:two-component system sensor histidine kinase KdpD